MEIQEAIERILRGIPEGNVFDSHFVIDALLSKEDGSDAYLAFASTMAQGGRPTLTTHQQIGHTIKKFCGSLIEQMPNDSWSMTIHNTPGKCAAWKRI
jgi:hypothetical protein